MALFVLASKDGWVSIMYQGLDAVGVDQQVGGPYIFKQLNTRNIYIDSIKS